MALTAAFVTPVQDPDFWWHIRTGRWIVEHRALPSHDLFTYTVPGHAWTDHEYLTEVLMWLGYSATGTIGIAIGFGILTFVGFLLILAASRPGRQPYVIVGLGLALGAAAGGPIWGPRAQMITFLIACLELYWLRGYLAGRSRAIMWFPLVMALWANLHGGWVIGFAFLGVAFVSEALKWLADRSDLEHRMRMQRLALVGVLSVLAVLATPHGLSLYLYPFQTQGSVAQQKLIVEWFSPDFHQIYLRPFEAMLFLLIAGFALRRPSLYDMLLTLLVLGLALQSVRHIALFVAATTPILISTWSEVWRGVSARRGWRLGSSPTSRLMAGVTVLALGLIAALVFSRIGGSLADEGSLTVQTYPVGAADWLAANPGVGTHMFNQYGFGGYLVYRLYPAESRRVFVFGEAELMGDELLNSYEAVQSLHPDWQKILDKYGVDYVVDNKDAALSNVLRTQPAWKVAYEDKTAVIFVRQP